VAEPAPELMADTTVDDVARLLADGPLRIGESV
jgi:hypothetical protein